MCVMPAAHPKVQHLKPASPSYAPALLENIRLGWKGLPGTKALAYYKHLLTTDVFSFIILASE
jgi:hypothetical protein